MSKIKLIEVASDFFGIANAFAIPHLLITVGIGAAGASVLIALLCHITISKSKSAGREMQERQNVSVRTIQQLCILFMVVGTFVKLAHSLLLYYFDPEIASLLSL